MIAVRCASTCVARAGPGAGQAPRRRASSRLPVALPFTSFAPSAPSPEPALAQQEVKGERVISLLTDLLEAQVRCLLHCCFPPVCCRGSRHWRPGHRRRAALTQSPSAVLATRLGLAKLPGSGQCSSLSLQSSSCVYQRAAVYGTHERRHPHTGSCSPSIASTPICAGPADPPNGKTDHLPQFQ